MPRRGRSPSPAPAPRRSASNVPAPVAPTPPPAPITAAPAAPQQPGMFAQMAATAGGVAVGSAIGHTVGHAVTGMFSGGGNSEVPAPQAAVPAAPAAGGPTEPQGPCAWEIKQFLQCAQGQADLTLCEGFNEALRQCKAQHSV